ncbi:uncharacterized protein [Dermacentor andersoni]|uniref:uncharacterized protein isoform X2 n=1 Tax=Dermacentor andersoni TaxID=34620 RepID=UPI003B3B0843
MHRQGMSRRRRERRTHTTRARKPPLWRFSLTRPLLLASAHKRPTVTVAQLPVLTQHNWNKGLTSAMSLAESITAKMACNAPSKVVRQVEVGMQCSLSLVDKSVGGSLKPRSESRSVQTTEAVEKLSSTSVPEQSRKNEQRSTGCEWTAGETKLLFDYYEQYFAEIGLLKK